MNYEKNYFGRLLNATSQGLHALFGGSGDISMSGRCGYEVHSGNSKFYRTAERIVDWSFLPVDGERHCLNAYYRDPSESYEIKPSTFLVVVTCVLGALILRPILWLIGKVLNYNKK